MKKEYILLLVAILMAISKPVYAQNRVVGCIFDKETNRKISGVMVYTLEQNNETKTDSSGHYVFTNLP